ncbi:MAG: M60 family metallopeptidase [Blastocatellia bacterium]
MRRIIGFILFAILAIGGIGYRQTTVNADQAADHAALLNGLTTVALSTGNVPGAVAVHGRKAFPLLIETATLRPTIAAGYYNDDESRARAVAFSHTNWVNVTDARAQLTLNALRWAGRKQAPVVGLGAGLTIKAYLQQQGMSVKDVSTSMDSPENDLSGVDVFLFSFHSGYTDAAFQKMKDFAAGGGGLLALSTPWALNANAFRTANEILLPFGLGVNPVTISQLSYTAPAQPYSPYHSALNAVDALIKQLNNQLTLTLEEQRTAALAVENALGAHPSAPILTTPVKTLSDAYGLISVTTAMPIARAGKPIEAMLVRYQSNVISSLPAAEVPVHPSAADWPGLPAEGPAVTRTLEINANAPPDVLINYGNEGLRIPTGLYAKPGAPIAVTIPADKANRGLAVQIGIHQDENWNLANWTRFPKVYRRDPLNQAITETACAFGGLVFIRVPPNTNLGTFNVTVSGAVEAPWFKYGVHTDAEWNDRIKQLPGAWGMMSCEGMTIFVSRRHLLNVNEPNKVIGHWDRVMRTADEFLGYSGRRREEAAVTDRQITVGFGHAGYPFLMAYGDSDALVNSAVARGDWGFYHELGHAYQDSFDGNYIIATHAEVCVNLVPGLLMSRLHGRVPWDNDVHSTFNATNRLNARTGFLARPSNEQTWDQACTGPPTAYDFYFNLYEAFGWDLYKRAHGRLFRFLQNAANDADLASLDRNDPNYRRNRIFLLYSQESGRNLAQYFERYGLGRGNFGITQSVKDRVANLPIWTDNQPVSSLSNPGALVLPANTPAGTPLYLFTATDSEPGTVFTFSIESGNDGGAFAIDKQTGLLTLAKPDSARPHAYNLTVKVSDNGVPRTSQMVSFTVTPAAATRQSVSVSAADFTRGSLAIEGIAAAFGTGLATTTIAATALPLPTTLAGTTVKTKDAAGAERLAPLFFVAPTQVNYQIPAGTQPGIVTVTITASDGTTSTATEHVRAVAPSVFTANANGSGVPAAYAVRVSNGVQTIVPVASFDEMRRQFVAEPIDLGAPEDQVVLVLFGAGLRKRSELAAVRALVGFNHVTAAYAGEAPGFAGLDQINLPLPCLLAGRGEIEVSLTVDGVATNPVRIAIK